MAQTGFTPIQLYRSTTTSAVPIAGNLLAGELAINTVDEKLYFKNNAGTVKLLAANITPVANGGTGLTSTPSNGQLLIGNGSGFTLATITQGSGISISNSAGGITISSTVTPGTGTVTSVAVSGGTTGLTTSGGPITSSGTITLAGTLAAANGGTGATTLTGLTIPQAVLAQPVITQNMQVIGTDTTAVASRTYVLTASLTLTLPASPSAGNWVAIQNSSGTATAVIARNSSNIMSLAEDMTIDNTTASLTLVYADATRGWVISL